MAGVPTVACDGVVDLGSIAVFRDALLRCIHAHAGQTVVVDIDGVSALDDAGLGILLGAAATARQAGGDLDVVCTNERMLTRLERTHLDRALTVRRAIT